MAIFVTSHGVNGFRSEKEKIMCYAIIEAHINMLCQSWDSHW